MWVGVWFTLAIILLEYPKKNLIYFTKLGFVFGMLIGSKYTAIYFIIVLIVFYLKKILSYINIWRTLAFLVPFSLFGLFWYIRNYLLTANPFYPIARFGFKGPLSFNNSVLIETIHHPIEMLNAGFGEYHLWLFSILISITILIHHYVIKKDVRLDSISKVSLIGLINFIFYFTFPTSSQTWIMTSSFRYSLPSFIPLILVVFMLAKKYGKAELIGYFVIANMINRLTMAYYPKLIIIYLPISLAVFYFINKRAYN